MALSIKERICSISDGCVEDIMRIVENEIKEAVNNEKTRLLEKLEKQQVAMTMASDQVAKVKKKLFELTAMEKEQRTLRAQAENKLSVTQEQILRLKQEFKSIHAKR